MRRGNHLTVVRSVVRTYSPRGSGDLKQAEESCKVRAHSVKEFMVTLWVSQRSISSLLEFTKIKQRD